MFLKPRLSPGHQVLLAQQAAKSKLGVCALALGAKGQVPKGLGSNRRRSVSSRRRADGKLNENHRNGEIPYDTVLASFPAEKRGNEGRRRVWKHIHVQKIALS